MVQWSRIQDTALAYVARAKIDGNTDQLGLEYHNWDHVSSLYKYLADTNEPYNEALDWAVLFHDIVYDAQTEKEFRSAKMFVEMVDQFDGCRLSPSEQGRVYSLIMRTVDHIVHPSVNGSSAIVRADLHGLADPVQTMRNFINIMDESCALYSIDPKTFAENSVKFMTALYERVSKNVQLDEKHSEFYKSVLNGIDLTISLAEAVKGKQP